MSSERGVTHANKDASLGACLTSAASLEVSPGFAGFVDEAESKENVMAFRPKMVVWLIDAQSRRALGLSIKFGSRRGTFTGWCSGLTLSFHPTVIKVPADVR